MDATDPSEAHGRAARIVAVAARVLLGLIAVLVLIAGAIGTFGAIAREFPTLLDLREPAAEVSRIVDLALLGAIAAELALLLVFHRAETAVEVAIFVIARKTVASGQTALDLLFLATSLTALVLVWRFATSRPRKGDGR